MEILKKYLGSNQMHVLCDHTDKEWFISRYQMTIAHATEFCDYLKENSKSVEIIEYYDKENNLKAEFNIFS